MRSGDLVYDLYELRQDDPLPDFAAHFVGSEPYKIIESYLSSSKEGRFPSKNYVGRVEQLGDGCVQGWAGDLSKCQPIDVTIWRLGKKIAKINCDIPRQELKDEFGHGPQGFFLRLDQLMEDPETFAVTFEDTPLCLF